jgi:hypothetical protein
MGSESSSDFDPGKGWRLLRPDEWLREGDEWLNGFGGWSETTKAGSRIPSSSSLTYRRRVEAPAWGSIAVYIARLLERTLSCPVVDRQEARGLARDLREHLEREQPR